MKKLKRLATLAVAGLLGVQMLGIVPAFAANDDECDFGSDNLEITIGDTGVSLGMDAYGILYCEENTGGPFGSTQYQAAKTIKSITVELDNEDAVGYFEIYLDDNDSDLAEWPKFATFDIDVPYLYMDATSVDYNNTRVTFGPKSVSFSGTTATTTATHVEYYGSDYRDFFDGSKSAARFWVYGEDGNDTIVGGPGKDYLEGGDNGGSSDLDKIYGGPGNDYIDCGNDGNLTTGDTEQGWGQDGDDYIYYCTIVAPGLGDDYIENSDDSYNVSYADVSTGMTFTDKTAFSASQAISTSGGAGDDQFDSYPHKVTGTQGDDSIILLNSGSAEANGAGGNDYITGLTCAFGGPGNDRIVGSSFGSGCGDNKFGISFDDHLSGGPGNDTLVGKGGADLLAGGPGYDRLFAGDENDACVGGEVLAGCELVVAKIRQLYAQIVV